MKQAILVLFDGDGYYDLAAGWLLERMVLLPGTNAAAVKAGKTLGGEEIFKSVAATAGAGKVRQVLVYHKTAVTRIYISGLPAGSGVVFLYRLTN